MTMTTKVFHSLGWSNSTAGTLALHANTQAWPPAPYMIPKALSGLIPKCWTRSMSWVPLGVTACPKIIKVLHHYSWCRSLVWLPFPLYPFLYYLLIGSYSLVTYSFPLAITQCSRSSAFVLISLLINIIILLLSIPQHQGILGFVIQLPRFIVNCYCPWFFSL